MFQVLLILSVVFSIYSVVEATCPAGWSMYGDNCYKFGLVAVPWPECQSTCANLNAMMLCIPDATTNAWLWAQTGDALPTWIGLSDIDHDGTYTWVSGCSSTYTNWEYAQPDNPGPGGQYYVYFWGGRSGKWDNVYPSVRNICACQISFDVSE